MGDFDFLYEKKRPRKDSRVQIQLEIQICPMMPAVKEEEPVQDSERGVVVLDIYGEE